MDTRGCASPIVCRNELSDPQATVSAKNQTYLAVLGQPFFHSLLITKLDERGPLLLLRVVKYRDFDVGDLNK